METAKIFMKVASSQKRLKHLLIWLGQRRSKQRNTRKNGPDAHASAKSPQLDPDAQ